MIIILIFERCYLLIKNMVNIQFEIIILNNVKNNLNISFYMINDILFMVNMLGKGFQRLLEFKNFIIIFFMQGQRVEFKMLVMFLFGDIYVF